MPEATFEKSVGVYGTDQLRIQCYLLFRAIDFTRFDDLPDRSWSRFTLTDDCNEQQVLLLEKSVQHFAEFICEAITILTWSSHQSSVGLAALIFDGGYCESDGVFSEETLDQVYGVWVPSFGPVLTLDQNVMRSPEWKNLLRRAKQLSKENKGENKGDVACAKQAWERGN